MKISKTTAVWLSAVAVVLTLSTGQRTQAQVLITGRTALDNAASAGGRSPGDLATAGVGRAIQAARDGRSIHTISEQEDTTTGPNAQFFATAGSALVTQAFDFFFFFVNRFLAREGLPPIFPAQLTVPITGGGTGGTPAVGDDTLGTGTGDPTGTGGETATPPQTGTADTSGTGPGVATGNGTFDTTGTDIVVETQPGNAPGGVGTTGGRRPVRKTAASSGR